MTLRDDELAEWTKLLQGITELSAEIAVLRDRVQQRDAEIERLQLEIDRRFGIAAEMIAARKERDDLRARLAAADAEVARLRESNRKLHRRCQEAESALPSYRKLIALPPDGDGVRFVSGTMGRALLVSMCNKLQAHGDAADALLRDTRHQWPNLNDALRNAIDAHLQGAGDEA